MKTLDITQNVDFLKTSPMFNFSLGSKELFHSNFLAWFVEEYPVSASHVLNTFCIEDDIPRDIINVARERKNKDLTIYFSDNSSLIVENKVKSIPSLEQLSRYSKDCKGMPGKTSFLLLSLMRPLFVLPKPWQYMNYGDLSNLIEKEIVYIENSYHKEIVYDYVRMVKALHTLVQEIHVADEDLYNFCEDGIHIIFREIRIGDLYHKLRFQLFALRIETMLKESFPESIFSIGDREGEKVAGQFYINIGMTRGQGLVEVAYMIIPGLFITIQIQDNHYKQMVQGYAGYGTDAKRVAKILKEHEWWFNFVQIQHKKEYPKDINSFNKYGTTDFYRSVSLDNSVTVRDIIYSIVSDIRTLKQQEGNIKAILPKRI
ncbi:MAG: PD-(D/E)XK nuclease family protein [Candidatus Yonathbacteria bacterium]|nr:PD-(D/E)XK nuclease family protein [Candidatus Yonathbacteria bacterium]NTW47421.1 PD-(D/E)XK nuclease family protein [Candidatus Yonathbacteria bacterium]